MGDELERYESAAGWEPRRLYKKQREQFGRQEADPDPADSMLEIRPASEWIARGCKHGVNSIELFGSLWREGEVAVLFGDKGSGKSILAVQIAEAIARGRNTIGTQRAPTQIPHPRKVLYIDFQRTKQQFAERYSAPSPIPGKLPVKCRFKFTRAQIEWNCQIPDQFKNDLHEYLQHSIFHKIEESQARIVIIDDISYLDRNAAGIRMMKTLKLRAATYGLSILVIANMKENRKPAPIKLNDIAGSRHIAALADSVFAINRSTFGPEYRYVKQLASPNSIIHDAANVLTYQLERRTAGTPAGTNASASENSPNTHSSSPTPLPFLGLTHLGPSNEPDHLRDYARESRLAEHREKQTLRHLQTRTARKALIEGYLDGSYPRYLKS